MSLKTDITGFFVPLIKTFNVPIIIPPNGRVPHYGDKKFPSEFYAVTNVGDTPANTHYPVDIANRLYSSVREVFERNQSPLVAISFRWPVSYTEAESTRICAALMGFLREDGSGDEPLEQAKEREARRRMDREI